MPKFSTFSRQNSGLRPEFCQGGSPPRFRGGGRFCSRGGGRFLAGWGGENRNRDPTCKGEIGGPSRVQEKKLKERAFLSDITGRPLFFTGHFSSHQTFQSALYANRGSRHNTPRNLPRWPFSRVVGAYCSVQAG